MLSAKSDQNTFECDSLLWDHPEKWPQGPVGYVFLARAFHEIGSAMFNERWVDDSADLEPEDPDERSEDPKDDCDDTTWDQYERACDQAKSEFRTMRASVARMIAEECETGNLVTALRSKSGGKMVTLESFYWNTENFWSRFSRCDMSQTHPFPDAARRVQRDCWLFVTQHTLDQLLANKNPFLDLAIQPRGVPDTRSIDTPKPFQQSRAHRRHLAKKALIELYGSTGPGLGITEERCYQDVDAWVRAHGEPKGVSKSTVRRAKHDLRSSRGNIEPS
jgi:hypothetical protein